ncbi:helix-turn-helix domain-containing protein, partial [Escherichia coli]|uniref:helix-turn-helix domain-containing protein n=1 Tax=Escherichia coli TaxID=562 RepID=UPI00203CBDE0
GTVCVVGKMRDLILQLSKSSIYSTKPHQRTRISRSVVAEVLAALRKGGYIEMNKGKLVAINRLPSEY